MNPELNATALQDRVAPTPRTFRQLLARPRRRRQRARQRQGATLRRLSLRLLRQAAARERHARHQVQHADGDPALDGELRRVARPAREGGAAVRAAQLPAQHRPVPRPRAVRVRRQLRHEPARALDFLEKGASVGRRDPRRAERVGRVHPRQAARRRSDVCAACRRRRDLLIAYVPLSELGAVRRLGAAQVRVVLREPRRAAAAQLPARRRRRPACRSGRRRSGCRSRSPSTPPTRCTCSSSSPPPTCAPSRSASRRPPTAATPRRWRRCSRTSAECVVPPFTPTPTRRSRRA